jgi:hypothetical protein
VNPGQARDPVVYALSADGGIFYVGHTRQNWAQRMWEHRSRARSGHPAPVYERMREVGIDNVTMVRLQGLKPDDDAEAIELVWIRHMLQDHQPIVNDMSVDGVLHSNGPSMRRRVSATKRGRSTWIKGKTGEAAGWTDERRAAQAARIRALNEQRASRSQ